MYESKILPVSDLSRNMTVVERLAIEEKMVLHVSKNSRDHLVVMSSETFRQLMGERELYMSLLASELQAAKQQSSKAGDAKKRFTRKMEEKLTSFYADRKTV